MTRHFGIQNKKKKKTLSKNTLITYTHSYQSLQIYSPSMRIRVYLCKCAMGIQNGTFDFGF